MKKLTKILVIVLSVALLLAAFVIAAAAADTAPAATTAAVFDIYDANGAKTESKSDLIEALKACPDGGKIVMNGDYEHGPRNHRGVSLDLQNKAITLDLAGNDLVFSYGANDANAVTYQHITGSNFNLTIKNSVAGGKIVSGSSFILFSSGKLTIDGTENAVNCESIICWKNDASGKLSGFNGGQFFKVGGNNGANASKPVMEIKGKVNFTINNGSNASVNFVGVQASSKLLVNNAEIVCNNAEGSLTCGLFIFSTTNNATTYNNNKAAITSPTIELVDSKFKVPANALVDFTRYSLAANAGDYTYDKAPILVIDGCDIDGVATRGATSLFRIEGNPFANVKLIDTKIKNTGALFEAKETDTDLPNSTVYVKGCNIEQTAWAYAFKSASISVKVEDSFILADAGGWLGEKSGYPWKYTEEIAEGETVPAYADPANKDEEWFFGGYGRLLGSNVYLRTTFNPAVDSTKYGTLVAGGGSDHYVWRLAPYHAIESQRTDVPNLPVRVYNARIDYETSKYHYDFESAELTTYVDRTSSVSIGGASFIIAENSGKGGRDGKYTVTNLHDNTFVVHEHHNSYINGAYIDLSLNNDGSYSSANGYGKAALDKNLFYSLEFDVASPVWKFAKNTASFGFYMRKYTGTSLNFFISDAVTLYGDDNGKGTIKVGDSTKVIDATTGEWSHIQIILAAPVVESGKDTDDYALTIDKENFGNFDLYLYVNGEFVGVKEDIFAAKTADLKNLTDYKKVAVSEIRINFPDWSDGAAGATAYDNIHVKRYNLDYTAGAKNYQDTFNSLINKDYVLPTTLPFATLESNGVVDYYNDFEALYDDAAFLAYEDDVYIELFKDTDLVFNPEEIGDGVTVTVKTNGHKFTVDNEAGFIAADNGDGTFNVRYIEDSDYVKATWLDKDGNLIDTTAALAGTVIAAPEAEAAEIVSKYYTAIYDGWAVVGENGELTPIDADNYTLNANVTLKQIVKTVDATFNELYFNYGVSDNMRVFLYIAADFVDNKVDENIKFDRVRISGAERGTKAAGSFGGVEYKYADSYPEFTSFATDSKCTVEYTVTIDGIAYPIAETFTVSALKYCDLVLSAEEKAFTAEERTLVANLVRYANVFQKVKSGAYNTNINALYTKYASLCTAYEQDLLAETQVDPTNLAPYIKSAYVSIVNGRAQYVIEFVKDSKVTGVAIAKDGYVEGEDAAYGNIILGSAPGSRQWFFNKEGTGNVRDGADSSGYYSVYYTENVRPHSFFGKLTITFTLEGGDTVVGTYDLNTWYHGAEFKEGEKELWADLFMALKELADSQTAYRFKVVE